MPLQLLLYAAGSRQGMGLRIRPEMGLQPVNEKRSRGHGYRGNSEEPGQTAARMLHEYGNSILRLAYSYLHNMSDAEDVVQETLIRYLKHQPHFTGEDHEKAWLLRVAANLSKNKLKYNKIRETDVLEDTLAAEEREDLTYVWEAVKELKPKYREAIHLFYHEGYSVKEIAAILQRNESTVRSDLRRGREQLRAVLKEAYDFE